MRGCCKIHRFVLVAFILLSVLSATGIAIYRMDIEKHYDSVELVVDYAESSQAALMANISQEEYLFELRKAGAVSMAVAEDTLATLEARGDVMIISEAEVKKMSIMSSTIYHEIFKLDDMALTSSGTYIICLNENISERLETILPIRLKLIDGYYMTSYQNKTVIYIPLDIKSVAALNLGFDESIFDNLNSIGFDVVVRISNGIGINDSWIDYIFSSIENRKFIKTVVFSGEEVLGYPDKLDYVSEKMFKFEGLFCGNIEFSSQRGIDKLLRKDNSKLVRVHSVTRAEFDKGMDFNTASDRYCRAVRERNIRMLYMRPFSLKSVDTDYVNLNIQLISEVSSRLSSEGFVIGNVEELEEISTSNILLAVLVLGTSSAFMLVASSFMMIPAILSLFIPIVCAGCFYFGITLKPELLELAVKFASLATALIFPVIAGIIMLSKKFENSDRIKNDKKNLFIINVLCRFVLASSVSIAGGLILSAFLTRNSFMLKLDQFMGVKLMHVLPILVVMFIYWLWYVKNDDKSVISSLCDFANSPILFWHAGLVGILGIVGIIFIVRTGNTSIFPIGMSDIEQSFRSFLERTLVIRPRTKELLLGHPAFILAGTIMSTKEKFLLFPIYIVAMIGQVSMVNTFAHMHSPISITLTRTFLGIGIGFLIGLVLAALYSLFANKLYRRKR